MLCRVRADATSTTLGRVCALRVHADATSVGPSAPGFNHVRRCSRRVHPDATSSTLRRVTVTPRG